VANAKIDREVLTFANRNAFLASYVEKQGQPGGLMLPDRPHLGVGDAVHLEVVFADRLMIFQVRGVVGEHFSMASPAMMRVDLPSSVDPSCKIVLEYVNGTLSQEVQRRGRRFPVDMELEYATDEVFTRATTEDLNKTGAFLVTDDLLEAGTLLAIRIQPPGGGPAVIFNAEVAWQRKREPRGFGVLFLSGDPKRQKQIGDLVEALVRQQTAK